ncbi:MAG: leucine-rich repeat domain-containing protein, partial [Mogibacterium sp.]|nr:leucine-rich repeat domain-containing protein [Mogibacterium sp.]
TIAFLPAASYAAEEAEQQDPVVTEEFNQQEDAGVPTELPEETEPAEPAAAEAEDPAEQEEEPEVSGESGETEVITEDTAGPEAMDPEIVDPEDLIMDDGNPEDEVPEEEDPENPETGVVHSGTCGENLTWTITGSGDDLLLTISGSGKMTEYTSWCWGEREDPPWNPWQSSITEIVVENGVTSISCNAFPGMDRLTKISLPFIGATAEQQQGYLDFIGYIFGATGAYADYAAVPKTLRTVIITGNITAVPHRGFNDCRNITSITLPDSVTKIGSAAFENCSGLKSINIPSGVKTIGEGAFWGCTSLTSLDIPNGATISRNSIPITLARITGISNFAYRGKAITPVPILTLCGRTLTPGTYKDYTVKYTNNTSVGTATVTITSTSRGICGGTVTKSFQIIPCPISKASVSGVGSRGYTGKPRGQAPVVTYNGTTLKLGTDYTLSYRNNINVGTATMIITGKGNYTGSIQRTFPIVLQTPSLSCTGRTRGKTKLTWSKVPGAAGYELYVRFPGKSYYKKVLTKSAAVKSVTHSGVTKNRIYYYRVRAYVKVNGKLYYSSFSPVVKVRAK